jgi:hypothetical protein
MASCIENELSNLVERQLTTETDIALQILNGIVGGRLVHLVVQGKRTPCVDEFARVIVVRSAEIGT